MRSLLTLAYKLLVNDRAKFAALTVGLTFSVFLMVQMTSMFSGILQRASATVVNTGAALWVMDPAVTTVANSIPMPDYVLDAVRSMKGVNSAIPLYSGGALVKLNTGVHDAQQVAAQSRQFHAAQEGLRLTEGNYHAGLVDYLQVLIANGQYEQATISYIGGRAQRLQDTVALFVALGGGWWDAKDVALGE